MTNNVNNVALGKPKVGGAIFRAPLGTPLPSDATSPLGDAFVAQGYVSDEGVTRAINKAFASIRAWGTDEVVNSKTEETVRLNFALLEASGVEALRSAYGNEAVTVEGGRITVDYKGDEPEDAMWVVDMEFKGKLRRVVFPHLANVTEDFSQSFTDEDPITLPFSLAARKADTRYFRDIYEDPDESSSSSEA